MKRKDSHCSTLGSGTVGSRVQAEWSCGSPVLDVPVAQSWLRVPSPSRVDCREAQRKGSGSKRTERYVSGTVLLALKNIES